MPESVLRDGLWWVPVMDTASWLAWERRREWIGVFVAKCQRELAEGRVDCD